MRLGNYLSSLTKPELENLLEMINLSEEEEEVYWHLSRRRSKVWIADECSSSIGTISNRIKIISDKIERLERGGFYKINVR